MGAKIDLTNKKFERLLVLKESGKDKSGAIMWLCKCDCGVEKEVRGNDLRSGKIKSCGCLGKEKRLIATQKHHSETKTKPYKDLTNQKFGRLLVICFDEQYTALKREQGDKNIWWKCQCDCGNIIHAAGVRLTGNHTRSCGCLQREKAAQNMKNAQQIGAKNKLIDLTGWKCGRLTVLERANNKGKKTAWKCLCECGNIIEVTSQSLLKEETSSCGCLGSSLGEDKINNLLVRNNIRFLREVKFPDLKDKGYLRFDFGILNADNQIVKLIEYDGRQHTDTTSIWYNETLVRHDQMKNEYCEKHSIPLIRIPYTKLSNLTIKDLID